jgi:lipoprotein-anchoring transpeptidase ErfK/SrfK
MTKKSKRSQKKHSTVLQHLTSHGKQYLFSFVVGIFVYAGSSYYYASQQPTCANSLTCESDFSERIDNAAVGLFLGHTVIPPKINLSVNLLQPNYSILGVTVPQSEKHIYIDLSSQTLYAYQGETEFMKTLISSGKWGRTPVGNFNVWTKLRATRMAGGQGSDAYDLPNVPYVMYFYRDFGLHGAYWHNNFGHPMSHGCVNMRVFDIQTLFAWVDGPINGNLGTAVSVCDTFVAPNVCKQKNPIN